MSTAPTTRAPSAAAAPVLGHRFADELPEMATPWRAEAAPDPQLLVLDEALAGELGLDPAWLRSEQGVGLLVGGSVPDGARPVAQVYAGHQFGGWNPRLGDGRALLLGELVGADGQLRDLHLKGSGRTPYARAGDGLAAVGPMLREHVVSSAMHALGIPTTRALAVVATGRGVRREQVLPGAVLARVASSHLRVGSFQHARATGDADLLRRLADHAISRHQPDAAALEGPDRYLALLDGVIARQAELVARWMLVGFVHGVMNTDNMTISGESIDYGPCAFIDAYDPQASFSSIDAGARYAYGNQPGVAEWDLARLAEALLPLLDEDTDRAVELATTSLGGFRTRYGRAWTDGMHAKLGLDGSRADVRAEADGTLVEDLLALLQADRVDHTSFYRALAGAARGEERSRQQDGAGAQHAGAGVHEAFTTPAVRAGYEAWERRWLALHPDPVPMDATNPVHVPRNHLVEEALDAATAGDLGPVTQLVDAVSHPFDERPGLQRYAEPAPEGSGPHVTYCGT